MHILFVDDIPEMREVFCFYFKLKGHQLEVACDGVQALRIIEQSASSLDVIIMDYHMPLMNGLEVAHHLQGRNDLSPVPIILFTGDSREEVETQALSVGISRVLYKPLTPQLLMTTAQEVVCGA